MQDLQLLERGFALILETTPCLCPDGSGLLGTGTLVRGVKVLEMGVGREGDERGMSVQWGFLLEPGSVTCWGREGLALLGTPGATPVSA